jgi:hypothetical protein
MNKLLLITSLIVAIIAPSAIFAINVGISYTVGYND